MDSGLDDRICPPIVHPHLNQSGRGSLATACSADCASDCKLHDDLGEQLALVDFSVVWRQVFHWIDPQSFGLPVSQVLPVVLKGQVELSADQSMPVVTVARNLQE